MTKASAVQTIMLDLMARGLPLPSQEHRFCERKWRLDFAWEAQRVALELDGSVYVQGRHTRGAGYEADCRKLNTATAMGWRVFRVTTGMAGEAIDWLEPLLK